MNVKSAIALPAALALGLLLAACDNNNPPQDPVTTPPTAETPAAEEPAAEAPAMEAPAAEAAEEAAVEPAAEPTPPEPAGDTAAEADAPAVEPETSQMAAAPAAAPEADAPAAAATTAAEPSVAAQRGAADAMAAIEAAEAAAAEAPSAAAAAPAPTLPQTGLRPDTRVALNASDPERPYLGVWATDAANCATVDQAGATGYAVITGMSIRQDGDLTVVTAGPLTNGKTTLGDVEVDLTGPDALTIGGTAMVRCTTGG